MDRLDRHASERGKAAGMDQVARGKDDTVLRGIEIIKWLATRYGYLTCDCTWARGFDLSGDARILGVIFRQAGELGIIRKSKHFVETIQKKSHRAPIQVWESKLYWGEGDKVVFVESGLYSRIIEAERMRAATPRKSKCPPRPRKPRDVRKARAKAIRSARSMESRIKRRRARHFQR